MSPNDKYLYQFTHEEVSLMKRVGYKISVATIDEIYAKFAHKYPEWSKVADETADKASLYDAFGVNTVS